MSLLKLENLSKRYDDFQAVANFSLEIARGEFFGLLGASGAGKTTLLRIIAGLNAPSAGRIFFNEKDITKLAPEKRDFGMVFQNYALFPHLNVFENIAFGLKARKLPKQVIKQKVADALDLVKLSGFEKRRINELSGGQQQRVAIARTIAVEPRLLLFDEPLSNLDAALREETRDELRELVRELKLTAIYVTHDQEEAFALCDRVGIISDGRLLDTGTPRELYENPATVAVAKFLGRNNLIRARVINSNNNGFLEFQTFEGSHRLFVETKDKQKLYEEGQIVTLTIRPENLTFAFDESAASVSENNLLRAVISDARYFGAGTRFGLDASGLPLEIMISQVGAFKIGDNCLVKLPPNCFSVLEAKGI